MRPIIRVENLSKQYRIGTNKASYATLRDSLMSAVGAPLRLLRRDGSSEPNTIWALKDVSFEVMPGDVVGIIGRNGAGKSTLLKILSRVTAPTQGQIDLYGRVGSLLEVGTGFHAELTGRENIYLNGTILGMNKAEIHRKFDEIVAFAEVTQFIDTPVKHYSSGMYLRLAFAVAAHLETGILLVDEVLAVGDAQFQKKCLGRMSEVGKEGRTILFVSHNMVALQSLCGRAIWLDSGSTIKDGPSNQLVADYLRSSVGGNGTLHEAWDEIVTAPGNDVVRLRGIRVNARDGESKDPLTMKTPFQIEIEYWNLVPDAQLHVTLHLYTEQGVIALTTGSTRDANWQQRLLSRGLFRSICFFPGDLLNSGTHRFDVLIVKDGNSVTFRYESTVSFDVIDAQERVAGWYGKEPGVLQPALGWQTEQLSNSLTEGST